MELAELSTMPGCRCTIQPLSTFCTAASSGRSRASELHTHASNLRRSLTSTGGQGKPALEQRRQAWVGVGPTTGVTLSDANAG
jgi:hypothetical protein